MCKSTTNTASNTYQSPTGFHTHKCDDCGHVWEHSDKCRGIIKHHLCPECKTMQWAQYNGPKAPTPK